jgi:CHAT domain-containing protein
VYHLTMPWNAKHSGARVIVVRIATSRTSWCLLFGLLSLPCAAKQSESPGSQGQNDLAKARENLRAVEVAYPGNTLEVASALNALVSVELDSREPSAETLELVKREAAVAEAAAGPRSRAYVNALSDTSEVYVALSRPAEGRPFAEQAFEIAQKEFPETEEGINSADELAYVCLYLGDYPCAQRADETAIAQERKPGPDHDWDLSVTLTNYADLKRRMGDEAASGAAAEESLAVALRTRPNDPHIGVLENNLATHYTRALEFPKAIVHLNRAIELMGQIYGPDSPNVLHIDENLASLYSRTGQFPLAWKTYETALQNKYETVDEHSTLHSDFARSLAAGGNLPRAIEEGLLAGQMGRDSFVLQARTLPERQALAYDLVRARGLDIALSVLARNRELPAADIYQEMVRSRALVADEMARRQKNLNASNDPETARLLQDLNLARADLLAVEQAKPGKNGNSQAIVEGANRMEKIERALAERSAAIRNDERISAVRLEDVRHSLPAHSALISYVAYHRVTVDKVDPARGYTASYFAFVLHADSDRMRVFDLGEAKPINALVLSLRASADSEAHAGGLGSIRNERAYRLSGDALRKSVWDPVRAEIADAKLAIVVPDGLLNLIPFAGLPDGKGYLVEHGPVIHTLSSERDLVPSPGEEKKIGLMAIGSPKFDLAETTLPPAPLRDSPVSCDQFRKLEFHTLPGAAEEVNDIAATWRRWNRGQPSALLTGPDASRERFLDEAPHNRILHVATHAFLLDRSCGDSNPLLHAGLVFAGANRSRESSILTAQQIASLDLNGVDWAVLSACNTGNGELLDGEGVLGLQRAFRVAGARTVIMTLWPVDDQVTGRFMHELYSERFGLKTSTADAVWRSARKLLLERRAAGKSTHPWYWAGFVGSGGWE